MAQTVLFGEVTENIVVIDNAGHVFVETEAAGGREELPAYLQPDLGAEADAAELWIKSAEPGKTNRKGERFHVQLTKVSGGFGMKVDGDASVVELENDPDGAMGPAERAGVCVGDRIVGVNGQPVPSSERTLARLPPTLNIKQCIIRTLCIYSVLFSALYANSVLFLML